MSIITANNTNASTVINLDFVETQVNDTIQYSFALLNTARNFIAITSCAASSQSEANKLIALNSDDAYKAYRKAFSNF